MTATNDTPNQTKKMDPIEKAKWLAALRSGDYKQAKNILCEVNYYKDLSYCCIGVKMNLDGVPRLPSGLMFDLRNMPRTTSDGEHVFQWIVYMEQRGVPTEQTRILAEMNDSGKTFLEIADYIETNL